MEGRAWHVPPPGLLAGAGWVLAFLVGSSVNLVIEESTGVSTGYPFARVPDVVDWVAQVVRSLVAGPTEEVFFGAAAVTVLRRGGWSWPSLVLIVGTLRWVFHVYYGATSAGMFLWGCLVTAAYAVSGRVLLPALLHSMWDLQPLPRVAWPDSPWVDAPLALTGLVAPAVFGGVLQEVPKRGPWIAPWRRWRLRRARAKRLTSPGA